MRWPYGNSDVASRRSREKGELLTTHIAATLLIAALITTDADGVGCQTVDAPPACREIHDAVDKVFQGPESKEQLDDEQLIRATPNIKPILTWAAREGIKVEYRQGGGNSYDKAKRTIHLDTTKSRAARLDKYFEALTDFADIPAYGPLPDVTKVSREQYINDGVARTVTNAVQRIKFNLRLRGLGITGRADYPDQKVYEDAYDQGGEEAGREALLRKLKPELTPGLERHWNTHHRDDTTGHRTDTAHRADTAHVDDWRPYHLRWC